MIEGLIALGGSLGLAILGLAFYSGRVSQRQASTVEELSRLRATVEDNRASVDRRLDNDLYHIHEELKDIGSKVARLEGKLNGLMGPKVGIEKGV